ncbi:MAG: NAD(P)H-dependent oxidoreductase subunit E [Planctomycetota bacterium]
MAWQTKPSGTSTVDRRAEPYYTQAMRDEIDQRYRPRYETPHACLLPALHLVQHAYHWVPPQAMLEISEHLEIPAADVLDTASFYEEYSLEPMGGTTIAVCRSIACEVCDHAKLTEALMDELGIEVGETTEDGKFTLVELECLGACGGAPAALVGEKLCEFMTPEKLLAEVRAAKSDGH